MALGADMKTEWRMVTLKDCVAINESTYSPKEAWAHDRAGTYTRCVILCYRKLVSGAVQVTGTPLSGRFARFSSVIREPTS